MLILFEQARHAYHGTILYNKNTNFDILGDTARKNQYLKSKKKKFTLGVLSLNWLKWNTDARE